MKIAFLKDYSMKEFIGGANVTDELMIQAGIEKGHNIQEINHQELTKNKLPVLDNFDLIILSNINMFKTEVIEEIIRNRKYVTYNHDYLFCKFRSAQCETRCKSLCTPAKVYQDMYANSLLNIFLSPLQLQIHKKFFGMTMRDAIYIPSPIEQDKYRPNLAVQQDAYLYIGSIMSHKGVPQMLDFARANKKKIFHFAGRPVSAELTKQLKTESRYLGELDHKDIPKLLRRYKYFMVNPQWPESFGRTLIEAICSGCTLVKFEKSQMTGMESYNLSPANMISLCADAPNVFWDKIRGAVKC